jgi:hypothetical protein
MHLAAEDKPYVQKFNFFAPAQGTGTITIRAMLKTGPPNPTDWGDFWKLPFLTLTEGSDAKKSGRWYSLPNSVTCSQFCNNYSLAACDSATLSMSLDGTHALDQAYHCHGALFHECTGNPRADLVAPEGFCSYHAPSCRSGASCSAASDATKALMCVCGKYVLSAGSQAIPGFLTAFLALMSTWAVGHFRLGGIVFLGMFLAMSPVQAHNWMEATRGRAAILGASQFCSPTYPQLNRDAIHMQAAQGQPLVVEWAAAHGDSTYFAVMHDDDGANARFLTRTFMDNWLSFCPDANGGWANDTVNRPLDAKYHRFFPNFNLATLEQVNTAASPPTTYADIFVDNPIRSGPVWDGFGQDRSNSFFLSSNSFQACRTQTGMFNDLCTLPFNASLYPKTMLAQYKQHYMRRDRRCTYTNSSNPWLETVVRFQHDDVSRSFATALISVQGRKGAGRYQIHYKWSSYCDVMDVDIKLASSGLVANPYGTRVNLTGNIQYDQGHHCWFEAPRKVGQCVEVVYDTAQCQTLCTMDTGCRAYQLIPLQLKPTASGNLYGQFSSSGGFIPWDVNISFCKKSQFQNNNIPDIGAMICYPIHTFQDDYNSARPLWSFTKDMDHQGFYGTCYIKPRPVVFLAQAGVNDPADNTYRFLDKCVSCDNVGMDKATPRWGPMLKGYCDDCDAHPTPAKVMPFVANWTLSMSNRTFTDPAHWLSPGGSPYATLNECKILAKRDPTCSNWVMFSAERADRMRQGLTHNINGTATFNLYNTSGGYRFTPFSLAFSYYRTCACLDKAPANAAVGYSPNVDTTQYTMACQGATNASCVRRGFNIYQFA